MALLIELPAPLEEELAVEASREGVSTSEQAAFLLQLITASTRDGRKTPFRSVVKAYLRQNSLDADRLADVFEGLMAVCLQNDGPEPMEPDKQTPGPIDSMETDRALSLLRGWRSPEANCSVDQNVDISTHELPPPEQLIQRAGRMRRTARMRASSVRGKYAYLGGGSEEFMREKQLEIDREDRR